MSLEAALRENTEAMRVLTEVLTSGGTPTHMGKANVSTKVPGAAKAAPKAAEESEGEETPAFLKNQAKPAAPAKPAAKPSAPAKKDDASAYAPVKKAILDAIAGGHRKSITDMLAEYDAKTGQDLTPDVYDAVLEKIAVITGGAVDDLA